MKKFFLFDVDGTLTDTGPGIMECVQHTLSQLGWQKQPEAFLRQFVGPPLKDSFMDFCRLDSAGADHAIEIYREKYNTWGVYQSPLYPGAEEMLEQLSQAATLCVATSKREQGARKILALRGIEERFPAVVGDDGTRPSKALVIAEVLRLLGEPPREQVVMVGDRRYDVEGAREWGVDTIGAEYGYGPPGELAQAGAKWLVKDIPSLTELCLKLANGNIRT